MRVLPPVGVYVIMVIDGDGDAGYIVLGRLLGPKPALLPLPVRRVTVKDPVTLGTVRGPILMNRRHYFPADCLTNVSDCLFLLRWIEIRALVFEG